MPYRDLHERWKLFADSRRGKRVVKTARTIFVGVIVGVLVYQVSGIGWSRVLSALPTHPVFYVLVLAMYFLLPVTESVIYGRLWGLRAFECLPIMIRKRVLNVDVVGYSGEIYLFLWAKERVPAAARTLMGTIKDNLIVSSAASLSAAALLIGGFLLSGVVRIEDFIEQPSPIYTVLGLLAALFVGIIVYRFRGVIFSLPKQVLPVLGAAHLSRFLMGYVLQVAAWWVVMPETAIQTWAILLVIFVVINRIPFLPSSDLVFVSAGAGITPLLGVPVAPIVGMLLVRSAADRLLNLLFFSSSVWYERHRSSTSPDTAMPTDWDAVSEEESEMPASMNP